MKIKFMKMLICTFSVFNACLLATPSSLFWTYCTTDVQNVQTTHIGVDNYVPLYHGSSLHTDGGVTYGLLDWNDYSAEVGFDYIFGKRSPLFFNAKVGVPEKKFSPTSPAVSLGYYGLAGKSHRHDRANIVNLVVGKTFSELGGRVFVGAFAGGEAMGKNQGGINVGYEHKFLPTKDVSGTDYNKLVLAADYASGKNVIGGGGVGVYYYFTPGISLLTGPVFFNDAKYNGRWKWSIQLDIVV